MPSHHSVVVPRALPFQLNLRKVPDGSKGESAVGDGRVAVCYAARSSGTAECPSVAQEVEVIQHDDVDHDGAADQEVERGQEEAGVSPHLSE